MKLLIVIASLLLSAAAWSKPVSGELFYKKPSGDIARRAVTLDVPSRGQGEVVLSGNGFEWSTTDFWSTEQNGQTVFTAAFQTEFMGMKSVIAFQGTYLKGANEIIYSGNFYKREGHGAVNQDISDFKYNGGFSFNYVRN